MPQHHQRPRTNDRKPVTMSSMPSRASTKKKNKSRNVPIPKPGQTNHHHFSIYGPKKENARYNAGFAHTIVANAFRILNNMSTATTLVDGIPAVNFKSVNNDCIRPIFSNVDHKVFVQSVYNSLKTLNPFDMDFDFYEAGTETEDSKEQVQKAAKWLSLVEQFQKPNQFEGERDMLVPHALLNLWRDKPDGQSEDNWSKSRIDYCIDPTSEETPPMAPFEKKHVKGHKMREEEYGQVTQAELQAVANVYVDVLKMMMRCEEVDYQISLHDGIVLCTTYVVNQVSKLQAAEGQERTFKMRFEKIFGENSQMMQTASAIDQSVDVEKRMKGWSICQILKKTAEGLRNATPPSNQDLAQNKEARMIRGEFHKSSNMDQEFYIAWLQETRYKWHIDHFDDAIASHDIYLHNVAQRVIAECYPAIADGMHHVSKFVNDATWNVIHKYSGLFHHYMAITNELAKLSPDAEQNYGENCVKARNLLKDLEAKMKISAPYKVALDYWEHVYNTKDENAWYPISGVPESLKSQNFCKAMVHVHNNEAKFMNREIEESWKQMMHTPYCSARTWFNAFKGGDHTKGGNHTNGGKHAKGGSGNGKTHVNVTVAQSKINNGTAMSIMRSIQPKFMEFRLPNTNVYNTRTTPQTPSHMESERDHDRPVTEMAEVQARFSDLIF